MIIYARDAALILARGRLPNTRGPRRGSHGLVTEPSVADRVNGLIRTAASAGMMPHRAPMILWRWRRPRWLRRLGTPVFPLSATPIVSSGQEAYDDDRDPHADAGDEGCDHRLHEDGKEDARGGGTDGAADTDFAHALTYGSRWRR